VEFKLYTTFPTHLGGVYENKNVNLQDIMKRFHLIILIAGLLATTVAASAYNDNRNARVDSLEALLKGDNPPTGQKLMYICEELMRGYLPVDAAKAEKYGRMALALSYETGDPQIRQYVLRHFGLLSYGREDFTEAIDRFNQALAIADSMAQSGRYTQQDIDDAQSALYGSIANVYNLQGKSHLAIHYYQLALPIFERNGWLESQAVLHHNIAELYLAMGNHDKAEAHYRKAIGKGQESGDSLMVALPQRGLAKVYIEKGWYAEAQQTLQSACRYQQAHKEDDAPGYADVMASMARLNLMEGHRNLQQAKAYAREAAAMTDHEMMFEDKSNIMAVNCEVAMAARQWEEALTYGLQAIHDDSTATHSEAGYYKLLAEIYIQLGQKDKAQQMVDKMHGMMSRYATEHYQSGLSQMEVIYETEKKKAEIEALSHDRRMYGWMLVGAVGVLVMLVGLLVYRQMANRRQRALLAAKVALETETKERHIIARDLHDSLGGMLSLLKINLGKEDKTTDETVRQVDNIMAELRRVSHHLMPEELLHGGLATALHDFAVSTPGARFQTTGDIRMSKEQELALYRCAYELVNNALRHAQASHITIELMQQQNEVTLSVCDDGTGICEGETGGMGIKNISERIAPYHGTVNTVTGRGTGTETHITINV